VSTVGASPALGSLVDLDVLDNEVAGVETLGVGVGLSVLQEVEEELSGLDGPASLADTPLLACNIVSILISIFPPMVINWCSMHRAFLAASFRKPQDCPIHFHRYRQFKG
jgi:hypothetical protein